MTNIHKLFLNSLHTVKDKTNDHIDLRYRLYMYTVTNINQLNQVCD